MPGHSRRAHRATLTLLTLVALGTGLPAGAAAQQPAQDTTALPRALREAHAQWRAAVLRLDAHAAAAFFADSAVADVGGDVFTGRRSIVEHWLAPALGSLTSVRFGTPAFTVADAEVTERSSHAVTPADGSGDEPGNYVARWRRMPDGSWKVVVLEVY